jgi:hypothetical protein
MSLLIIVAVSIGWALLWILTCNPVKVSGLVKHSVIFAVLSLILTAAAMFIMFMPVDETYSASNKGAIGILFILWLLIFCSACLIAFIISLVRFHIIKSELSEKGSGVCK